MQKIFINEGDVNSEAHSLLLRRKTMRGRKSIIITSQLPLSKWYEYINDPTLADAIMDRLTANAVRVELKGESLRRKKSK